MYTGNNSNNPTNAKDGIDPIDNEDGIAPLDDKGGINPKNAPINQAKGPVSANLILKKEIEGLSFKGWHLIIENPPQLQHLSRVDLNLFD